MLQHSIKSELEVAGQSSPDALGSMQERKRRNRPGQTGSVASAPHRQTRRQRNLHCLRRKLHLDATDASTSDLFLQVQQEIGRLRTQICQEDQETKRVAIQKWRQDHETQFDGKI